MQAKSKSVDVGRLKILAEKANREHSQAQRSAQQSVKHGVEAGELLLRAKEEVGHGKFTEWIEKNFEGSQRQATRYMRLATAADEKRIDPDEVSSLREAEGLLRDQDAEQPRAKIRRPTPTNAEFEPEVPDEEYLFADEEEFKKWSGECEAEDRDGEHETGPTPKGATPKPARKGDLQTSAFSAMNRYIHEMPGEEKDRIQAIREHLDMEESGLLALASEEGRGS
jgi:hypothetical protein